MLARLKQTGADSAQDLANALDAKNEIKLVTDRAAAQMTIRITGRVEAGKESVVGLVGSTPAFVKKRGGRSVGAIVKLDQREFIFVGTTDTRYWSRAASDLAHNIEKWVQQNYERIAGAKR